MTTDAQSPDQTLLHYGKGWVVLGAHWKPLRKRQNVLVFATKKEALAHIRSGEFGQPLWVHRCGVEVMVEA